MANEHGGALLLVIGEPFTQGQKDLILTKISRDLQTWDVEACDITQGLEAVVSENSSGEEGPNGERQIRFSSDDLKVDILINPLSQTFLNKLRSFLLASVKHRHLIYSGQIVQGGGNWVLQDDLLSFAEVLAIFREAENALKEQSGGSLYINSFNEGEWTDAYVTKQALAKNLSVKCNPSEVAALKDAPAIDKFIQYIAPLVELSTCQQLLQASDVVGNIRFSKPTLYIFPGCQGDSALFGISGFNLLVNGGYNRKACFWDFTRHLDRIDAVLMTHLGTDNLFGVGSVFERKAQNMVHPEVGYVYFNAPEKSKHSPNGDAHPENGGSHKAASLSVNLVEQGNMLVENMGHVLGHSPQACVGHVVGQVLSPINLYHKVGHGSLDMYVLSPLQDSKELKEFMAQWSKNVSSFSAGKSPFSLPTASSVSALLVWKPSSPHDKVTRILFPGNAPQQKVFEGLEKMKMFDMLKYPEYTDMTSRQKAAAPKKAPAGKAASTPKPSAGRTAAAAPPKKETPAAKKPAPKAEEKRSTPVKSLPSSKPAKDAKNKKVGSATSKENKTPSPVETPTSETKSPPPIVTSPIKAEPAAEQKTPVEEVPFVEPVEPEQLKTEAEIKQEIPEPEPAKEEVHPAELAQEEVPPVEPVKEEPAPVVKEEPAPVVKEEPAPVVKEEPAPIVNEVEEPVATEPPVPVESPVQDTPPTATPEQPTPESDAATGDLLGDFAEAPKPEVQNSISPEVEALPEPQEPQAEQHEVPPQMTEEPTEALPSKAESPITEDAPAAMDLPEHLPDPHQFDASTYDAVTAQLQSGDIGVAKEEGPEGQELLPESEQPVEPPVVEPCTESAAAASEASIPSEDEPSTPEAAAVATEDISPVVENQMDSAPAGEIQVSDQAKLLEDLGIYDEEPSTPLAPERQAQGGAPAPEQQNLEDLGIYDEDKAEEPTEAVEPPQDSALEDQGIYDAPEADQQQDVSQLPEAEAAQPLPPQPVFEGEAPEALPLPKEPEEPLDMEDDSLIEEPAMLQENGLKDPPSLAGDADSVEGSAPEIPTDLGSNPDIPTDLGSNPEIPTDLGSNPFNIGGTSLEDSHTTGDHFEIVDGPTLASPDDSQQASLNPFLGMGNGDVLQPTSADTSPADTNPFDIPSPESAPESSKLTPVEPAKQLTEDLDRDSLEREDKDEGANFDPLKEWGHPEGLPAPADPKKDPGTKRGAAADKKGPTTPRSAGRNSPLPKKPADKKPAANANATARAGAKKTTTAAPKTSRAPPSSKSSEESVKKADAPAKRTPPTSATRKTPAGRSNATPTASAKAEAKPAAKTGAKRAATSAPTKSAPPAKAEKPLPPVTPFYMDLTYVPCHGNGAYVDMEFFRKIRARYYVLSSLNPNPALLDALLDAKQTWDNPSLEVTIIPTYDTEKLRHWMALKRDQLAELKVDIAPSASRCTIQLQDHETSCAAYRLEF